MKRSRFSGALQLAVIVLVAALAQASATEIVNNSVQLETLSITPASGFIIFNPAYSLQGGLQNSLNENRFNSCPMAVTWATINCSHSDMPLTLSASTHINIPDGPWVDGGVIQRYYGSFSIAGTSGPVVVQFQALLAYSQALMTGGGEASSQIGFSVYFTSSFSDILDANSDYAIGPRSSILDSGTWDLSNSVILNAGQQYDLTVGVGDGAMANPEPATLWLLLGGMTPIVLKGLRSPRSHS